VSSIFENMQIKYEGRAMMKKMMTVLAIGFLFTVSFITYCDAQGDVPLPPCQRVWYSKNLGVKGTGELCTMYYYASPTQRTGIKAELHKRKAIQDWEWVVIEKESISLDMSVYGLYCSWGPPDERNVSVGSYGRHVQHIYNLYSRRIKTTYVYTENGKITDWQH
jgi:hypothetical protein